jgi:DNA-binding CsgD family transcriptional regulator
VRRGPDRPQERLTDHELRVALEVCQGVTSREEAAALFVSPKTVDFRLRNVYRKLGIRSRAQLARQLAVGTCCRRCPSEA